MKKLSNQIKFMNKFKNKRILVTGADGFIGSHLTEKLLSMGAKVSIFVRGNSVNGTSQYTLRNLKKIKKKLESIITGNIGSFDAKKLILDEKPDYIFHLAADAYVPNSFNHPLEVMETNLLGTINVLECLRTSSKIKQAVFTSSSEIYGLTLGKSINESHPLFPSSPYAASKLAADRYCYSYINTYKLPVSVIRPFNTFGPRHTYDVIPKFIDLALKNKPLTIYGDGKQARDFTYVDDMVDAFLIMGSNKKAISKFVNFGTGKSHSIINTARLIVKISNSKSKIIFVKKRLAEVPNLVCNYNLAKKLFKWKPKTKFENGLAKNIEWSKKNLKM